MWSAWRALCCLDEGGSAHFRDTAGGSNANLGTQTRTLLQSIEVLSAGQNIQKDSEGKPISVPVVNLLVTPEQAERLSLASNETRIQLILRNPLDTKESTVPGTALAYLYEGTPESGFKNAKGNKEAQSGPSRAARNLRRTAYCHGACCNAHHRGNDHGNKERDDPGRPDGRRKAEGGSQMNRVLTLQSSLWRWRP